MHGHHGPDVAGGGQIDENDTAVCPVMLVSTGKKWAGSKGLARTYEGNSIFLCCRTCGSLFDNNPEQYINDKETV